MESCLDVDFTHVDTTKIDNSFVESAFEAGLNFVLSRVECARALKKEFVVCKHMVHENTQKFCFKEGQDRGQIAVRAC